MEHSSDSGIMYDIIAALQEIDDEYLNYLLNQFEGLNGLLENIDLSVKIHPKHSYLILEKEEVLQELEKCEIYFLEENQFNLLKSNSNRDIKIEDLENIFGSNYIDLLFYSMLDEINFNYLSKNGASFNSLSHGEKTIYSFLVHLINYSKNELILLLDEPENTLHPNWQKSFLNELFIIINKKGKKLKKKLAQKILLHATAAKSSL